MNDRKLPLPTDRIDNLLTHVRGDNSEASMVVRRFLERRSINKQERWRLALAERLTKGPRPWSEWLLEHVAYEFLHDYEPKLRAEWERKRRPKRDRMMIDAITLDLKAQGVRAPRGGAKAKWATMQGISVDGLKQRHRRARQQRSKS